MVVLGLLLAFGLRFYHLEFESLWIDEIFTWLSASQESFGAFWVNYHGFELTPPFYFLIEFIWLRFFPDSEFWLRFPSLLAGLFFVFACYRLAKTIGGASAGLVALFLAAVHPSAIEYSQEARAYSMMMALVPISLLFWIRSLDAPLCWKKHFHYALLALLLSGTHVFGYYFVLAQGFFGTLWLLWQGKSYRRQLTVAFGLALVFFLWFLSLVQHLKPKIEFVGPPSIKSIGDIAVLFLGGTAYFSIFSLCLICWAVFFRPRKAEASVAVVTCGVLIGSWLIAQWTNAFLPRYLTSMLGPLLVLMSMGIIKLKELNKFLPILLIPIVLGIQLNHLFYQKKYYEFSHKEQMREAVSLAHAADADLKSEVIIYSYGPNLFAYYFKKMGWSKEPIAILPANHEGGISAWPKAAYGAERLILLSVKPITESTILQESSSQFHVQQDVSLRGAHLLILGKNNLGKKK